MIHPVAIMLERFFVGDLAPPERDAVQAHVAACLCCRKYLADLAAARAERLAAVPPALFVSQVAARRRRGTVQRATRSAAIVALLGAAAALAIIMRPPEVRYKGSGFFVERQRDGVVTRLGSDLRIRAGDALRVVAVLPQAEPVSLWFVDVSGRVDALFDGPQEMPAGEHALPGGVTVDAPCVDGWIVLATGKAASPQAAAELRMTVRGGLPQGGDVPPGLPAGARAERLRCE